MAFPTSQWHAESYRQTNVDSLRVHLIVFVIVALAVVIRSIAISDTPKAENLLPAQEAIPAQIRVEP